MKKRVKNLQWLRKSLSFVLSLCLLVSLLQIPVKAEVADGVEEPVAPVVQEEPVAPVMEDEPASEEPVEEEPVEEEPIEEEPIEEEPVEEEPVAEEPVTEEPVAEEPVEEEPVEEEPVAEEPVAEEPVAEEPVAEEPVVEEPVVEEPVAEEPVAEEPATEEPVAEEPATEEPVAEEPAYAKFAEEIASYEAQVKEMDKNDTAAVDALCEDLETFELAIGQAKENGEITVEEYDTLFARLNNVLDILFAEEPAEEVPAVYAGVTQKQINQSFAGSGGISKVWVAVQSKGFIPGEPAVHGGGYRFYQGGDKLGDGFYSNTCSGIISEDIVNYPNFSYTSVDGTNTCGLVDGTGRTTAQVLNINFDAFLAAIAKSRNVQATDGKTVTTSNVSNYKVVCYVVKLQTDSNTKTGWHIDCAVVPKESVILSYNLNLPDGQYFSSSIGTPDAQTSVEGADFDIAAPVSGSKNLKVGDVVEGKDQAGNEIALKFLGWNTSRNYASDLYDPAEDTITIYSDTVLYAIWESTATTGSMTIKKLVVDEEDLLSGNLSYTFTLDFEDDNAVHNYKITNSAGVATGVTGTVKSGQTITLTGTEGNMQEAVIELIAAKTTVTVTENLPTGYTASWAGGKSSNANVVNAEIVGGNNLAITCTNTFAPVGAAELAVTKVLEGRDWLNEETFTFQLKDATGKVIEEVEVTEADQIANFAAIDYTVEDAGETFAYTITETSDLPAGVTNSGDVTATVVVTEKDGKLETEVTYTNNATITNTYAAEATEAQFTVNKIIEDMSGGAQDGTFTFQLMDAEGAVLQTKVITTTDLTGTVSFDAIEYTEAGTYSYTIVEVEGDVAGMTYDTEEHPVVVTVTDNTETAKLEAEVTDDGEVTITNVYDPENAKAVIAGTKIVDDQSDSAPNEVFTFQLLDASGEVVDTVEIDGAGEFSFEEISYDEVGTYTYKIREVAGNTNGFTYDDSEIEVTVEVTDKEGALVAAVTYAGGEAVFTNVYKATAAEYVISLNKNVEGDPSSASTFLFNLLDDAGVLQTVSIEGAGEVSFDALIFEKAGCYSYGVEEVPGEATGYTYDTNKYVVEITVEDEDGVLSATAVNYKVAGENEPEVVEVIVFVNKYTAPVVDDGTPDTGDYSSMGMYMVLAVISVMGLAVIAWNRKRILG